MGLPLCKWCRRPVRGCLERHQLRCYWCRTCQDFVAASIIKHTCTIPGLKHFPCPICGRITKSSDYMKHLRTDHDDVDAEQYRRRSAKFKHQDLRLKKEGKVKNGFIHFSFPICFLRLSSLFFFIHPPRPNLRLPFQTLLPAPRPPSPPPQRSTERSSMFQYQAIQRLPTFLRKEGFYAVYVLFLQKKKVDDKEQDEDAPVSDDDDEEKRSEDKKESKLKYKVTERFPGSWRTCGAIYRVSLSLFQVTRFVGTILLHWLNAVRLIVTNLGNETVRFIGNYRQQRNKSS